jgi:HD-GYP domain-containing protein (c-di-GMP phosphodiesterase class II)
LSRGLDVKIRRGLNLKVVRQGKPFALNVRRHGAVPYSKELTNNLLVLLRNSTEAATDVFTSLATEMAPNLDLAESITRHGLSGAAEDLDLFIYLGCVPCSSGYPSKHALQTAMLAMCIGVTIGWDQQTLLDLGLGCLLHDVGMLGIEQAMCHSKDTLSSADFREITKHPVYTIQWLRRYFGQIPPAAQMVCYQMHERCNGSGYPRGYKGDQIHDMAKVAAVADVFVALVSPRPHRPGMVPYHALKKILQDTKEGFYDPAAVRGLLNTVSLFPIGSHVAFNDGRVGRVIRTSGETYDRPIVEVWRHQDPSAEHVVIDLSQAEGLKISAALVGTHP